MRTTLLAVGQGLDPLRALAAEFVVALFSALVRVGENAVAVAKARRKTMAVLAGLVLVAAVGFVSAQDQPDDPLKGQIATENANAKNVPQNNYTTAFVAEKVAEAITTGLKTKINADRINEIGQLLAGTGVVVMFAWLGLKTLAAGKGIGDLFAEWTPVLIAYGVVQIMVFVPLAGGTIATQLPATVDKIGSILVGSPIGDLKQSLFDGMQPFVRAVYQVMEMQTQSTRDNAGFFSNAAVTVLTGLLRIVTVIFIVLGMVVYCGVVLFADIAVKIGALFAPILIPFLIFKPMSGVFMGWVNFMIGASLTKVIAAVMAVLTAGIFTQLNNLSDTIAADVAKGGTVDAAGADVILFSFAILMSLICAVLMYQAPGIAVGLWNGNAGAAGFGGIGKGVGGGNFGTAPGRAAGGAAIGGAGWAAGKGIERTAGAYFAGRQGRNDAKNPNVPVGAQRYKSAALHRAYSVARQSQVSATAKADKAAKTDIAGV
jgi:type IV secretion system protein TrbL